METLLSSAEIKRTAIARGLDSGRKLSKETGVNVATCHQILNDDPSLNEQTLKRFTDFFLMGAVK